MDAALVWALDPLIGIPASVAYNKLGGTRALFNSLSTGAQAQACVAAYGPTPLIALPY